MNKLSNEELTNIRTSVDIVDIVSNYIPLTKRGKNYFGVCPFHEDSDPSLSVSQDKQIFSCFSCHTSGNVFNFVMEYEHISFIEAVKVVADKAGIKINIGQIKHENSFESKLYDIYDVSCKFYQNNLNTVGGKIAKEYLNKRSIDEELIREFNIGLSLKSSDTLTKLLVKKQFDEKTMIESGLVAKTNSSLMDLFRGRIMFPITDVNGKVVGYSGRIYDETDTSKYINTKETAIFKKGELLYNYAKAKNECRLKDTVIVTEGFMDVIRLYTAGVKNVVATMGTAITKKHANLLRRLASNVILLFDGDKAGNKATMSACGILEDSDLKIKIVRLPDNLDPDEYILKNGNQAILDALDNPMDVLQFKSEYYKQGKNLNSSEDIAAYTKEVIAEINKTSDEILQEVILRKLSRETNLEYEFLKQQIKPSEKVKKTVAKKEQKMYDKYTKAQMDLIHYMLVSGEVIKIYDNQTLYLPDQNYRLLAKDISYFYEQNGYVNVADLYNALDEDAKKTLSQIESLELSDNYTKSQIMDYIKSIRELNFEEQIKRIEDKIARETDVDKQIQLAQQLLDLKKRSEEDVERN